MLIFYRAMRFLTAVNYPRLEIAGPAGRICESKISVANFIFVEIEAL